MARNADREQAAKRAAQSLKILLNISTPVRRAIILGTGWGKALPFKIRDSVNFSTVTGFTKLPEITGHARKFSIGTYKGEDILVLEGRVHLNEIPCSEIITQMTRLQIELLFHLGVRMLISTSAVGSIREHSIKPGELVLVKDFFAPFDGTVLYGGEFTYPHKAFSEYLNQKALRSIKKVFPESYCVTHCFRKGPAFENSILKEFLKKGGADIVGMSLYPEAEISSLYPNVRLLGLCFVTNIAADSSGHIDNLKISEIKGKQLKKSLKSLFDELIK